MTVLENASSNLTNQPNKTSPLRVVVVRSVKLVAKAGSSSGTQRKGNSAVGSHYQATAGEETENFTCAAVQ
jgi:hypothetical protein